MLISDFQAEILSVVGNQNKSTSVLLWVQSTMREVRAKARWGWLNTFKIRDWPSGLIAMPLPDDFAELKDPLFQNTTLTAPGAYAGIWDSTTAYTSGSVVYCSLDGKFYSAVITNTDNPPSADTGTNWIPTNNPVWQEADPRWNLEKQGIIRFQRNDYQVDVQEKKLILTSVYNATSFVLGMLYYRKMNIPTALTGVQSTIDIPEEFAYDIVVYGAARKGLLLEDDYARMKWCEGKFETALAKMVEDDNRRGVANMRKRLGSPYPVDQFYPQWPTGNSW